MAQDARPAFPRGTPDAYAALARRCWLRCPHDRPAIGDVVRALRALRPSAAAALLARRSALPPQPQPQPQQPAAGDSGGVAGSGGRGSGEAPASASASPSTAAAARTAAWEERGDVGYPV